MSADCFNPRSRKGNDDDSGTEWAIDTAFQSTFPQGERHGRRILLPAFIMFQSTFPQGERRFTRILCNSKRSFQSTFPQGERHSEIHTNLCTSTFQSTFPQGERPGSCGEVFTGVRFNPRSRKGNDAEKSGVNIRQIQVRFNPRSRKGNDRIRRIWVFLGRRVSIHVPARGTTVQRRRQQEWRKCFNPRSRKGNDSS